jgi:hypothetical protein
MSLLSYRDVRPWATAIRQKVITRAMPPWHADPAHGTFRNDLRLTDREIDSIVRWVDGGAREGDAAALPPLPTFPAGWQIGTPDVVFQMPMEFEVPAQGTHIRRWPRRDRRPTCGDLDAAAISITFDRHR